MLNFQKLILTQLFIFIFVVGVKIPTAQSICKEDILSNLIESIIKKIDWSCIFPIRIAGVKIDPFKDAEHVDRDEVIHSFRNSLERYRNQLINPVSAEESVERRILCSCDGGILGTKIGITVSFWEPFGVVEVVKDAWCFPFIGGDLSNLSEDQQNIPDFSTNQIPANSDFWTRITKDGIVSSTRSPKGQTYVFWQAHYYIFPALVVLDVLTNFVCLDRSPLEVAYISEVMPNWDDAALSLVLHPETLLFANPLAVLGCAPESIASSAGLVIDYLYWCAGGWGNIYPITGFYTGNDYLESVPLMMSRILYMLHRTFVLMGTSGEAALCRVYPLPIWKKSMYRWQLLYPKREPKCRPLGTPWFLWESWKNPPSPKHSIDNFAIILFRKRTCCAY